MSNIKSETTIEVVNNDDATYIVFDGNDDMFKERLTNEQYEAVLDLFWGKDRK